MNCLGTIFKRGFHTKISCCFYQSITTPKCLGEVFSNDCMTWDLKQEIFPTTSRKWGCQEGIVRIGMHLGWKALKYHSLKSESWISTLSRSRTSSSLEVELRASAWNMTFQAILYSSSIQNPGLIQGFAWQSLHLDMPDILTPFSIKGTIKGFPFFDCRIFQIVMIWADLNFEWERTSSDRLEYVAFVPHQCDLYWWLPRSCLALPFLSA